MLCYSSIVDTLAERFEGVFSESEIKEDGDLPHVFFEHYFVPYIKKNIFEHNEKEIKNIFDYLEKMVESDDFEVNCLLQVSVLEALISDNTVRNELKKYMGFETEKIYNEILKYLR